MSTTVNLMPCSIKHTARSSGTKVPIFDICRSIISLSGTSNVAQYPFSKETRQQIELWRWKLEERGKGGGGLDKI